MLKTKIILSIVATAFVFDAKAGGASESGIAAEKAAAVKQQTITSGSDKDTDDSKEFETSKDIYDVKKDGLGDGTTLKPNSSYNPQTDFRNAVAPQKPKIAETPKEIAEAAMTAASKLASAVASILPDPPKPKSDIFSLAKDAVAGVGRVIDMAQKGSEKVVAAVKEKYKDDIEAFQNGARAGAAALKQARERINDLDPGAASRIYNSAFYNSAYNTYRGKNLNPNIQIVPTGPMMGLLRSTGYEFDSDFYDPRGFDAYRSNVNWNQDLQGQETAFYRTVDELFREGKAVVNLPGAYHSGLNSFAKDSLSSLQRFGFQNSITVFPVVDYSNDPAEAAAVARSVWMQVSNSLGTSLEIDKNGRIVREKDGSLERNSDLGVQSELFTTGSATLGGIVAISDKALSDGDLIANTLSHEYNHAGDVAVKNHSKMKTEGLQKQLESESSQSTLTADERARIEKEIERLEQISAAADSAYNKHVTE
ncbi:hypothetical protein K2X05_06845, partial [bacterium]|nr:hypothetical protein [bacterium]